MFGISLNLPFILFSLEILIKRTGVFRLSGKRMTRSWNRIICPKEKYGLFGDIFKKTVDLSVLYIRQEVAGTTVMGRKKKAVPRIFLAPLSFIS